MLLRLILLLCLMLAACSRHEEDAVTVIVLDGERGGTAGAVRWATVEGLVGLDEEGRVVPALADRWIVTDDGQSYIFRLRDGTWADGAPLTGETARTALRQALAGLKGSPLAGDFDAVDDVRAMAGRVVEIRLTRPVPEFLQLLAQPELGLARRGRGTGPMAARREGPVTVLVPIAPEKRGLPAVDDWAGQVRPIRLSAATARQALDRFEADGSTVVLGGSFVQWPALADARVPRGAVRLDPVVGLFGLAPLHADGFLSRPENREAVAMAIDREALAQALQAPGWAGTTRLVSPATEDAGRLVAERWTGLTPAQRQAAAAARVARWRARHGDFTLRIALPRGLGADVLFARLAVDLAAAGFKLARVGEAEAADLRLEDRVAPYARAAWFFTQLSCAVRPKVCSPEADARYAAAVASGDSAGRAQQLAQAEAELMAANTFIPLGPPLRWSLAGSDTSGFLPNRWGAHPLLPLAMRSLR